MKVKLDKGAKLPTKAHKTDAGFDIYSREEKIIKANDSEVLDTGVHILIPSGYVGFLKSKSGLNINRGLTSEGVIDADYTGSIKVKIYNNSRNDYKVNSGDKITQLVILPIPTVSLEVTEELEETERGSNGFGSTGR